MLCGGLLHDCDGSVPHETDWTLRVVDEGDDEVLRITMSSGGVAEGAGRTYGRRTPYSTGALRAPDGR